MLEHEIFYVIFYISQCVCLYMSISVHKRPTISLTIYNYNFNIIYFDVWGRLNKSKRSISLNLIFSNLTNLCRVTTYLLDLMRITHLISFIVLIYYVHIYENYHSWRKLCIVKMFSILACIITKFCSIEINKWFKENGLILTFLNLL